MRIERFNVLSRVVAASQEESWLDNYLTVQTTSTRFTGVPLRLYNRFAKCFPAGLTPRVLKAAALDNIQITLIDQRRAPCEPDETVDLSWLRDYQQEAVVAIIKYTTGILKHPTGAGKTVVAAALGAMLRCRWLFVVHRITLVQQTIDRFEQITGETAGIIADGVWNPKRFTVASFQTLYAKLKTDKKLAEMYLGSVEALIVDECHTLPSGSYLKVASKTHNAYWRVGLSGTPLARDDKRSILAIGSIGPIIHKVDSEMLISQGILAKPNIFITPVYDPVPSKDRKFAEVYKAGVVWSSLRNRRVLEDVLTAEKPCLVFVKLIDHGRELKNLISQQGLETEFVFGQDDSTFRRTAIKRLATGETDVLICSVIFQEGVDIPEVQSVVNAAGGKSIIALLQKLGRGMRTRDKAGNLTKSEFNVYDYLDRGNRWLEKQSQERIAAYRGEGYTLQIK